MRAAEERLAELDRIKSELELANARLKQADRLKSEFLASVSHELRTPLTSIRSFAEILGRYDDQDPEERRRYVAIITAETDRLTHLINDLLDLTKIEAGRADWSMRLLELGPVLAASVELMRPLAKERGILLELAGGAPAVQVLGDADRLKQVMTNLLSNAVKFTDRGGAVRVIVERDPDGEQACVRVVDSGIGMPEDQLGLIFDKFVQIKHPRRGSGGTGLGLPIVREIVEAHGGRVDVESRVGVGSTFTVLLPIAAGKSQFQAYLDWRIGYAERRGEPFTLVVVAAGASSTPNAEGEQTASGLRARIHPMVRASDAVLDHDRPGCVAVFAPVRRTEASALLSRIRDQLADSRDAVIATVAFPEEARTAAALTDAIEAALPAR
ncbi:MAG: HAMP domain-containing sensor histidine kinase [bacterium]